MFVILHDNFDPFMGGDYTFCSTKKQVIREIDFIGVNKINGIYDLTGKKDLKRFFISNEDIH